MFKDNPSKVFRPEDVGVEKALENYRVWFREMEQQAKSMREQGDDEETVYEHMLSLSKEAGEPVDMVVEILYSDGSQLPARTIEEERQISIDRLNSLIDALKEKVRLGDTEAIQLTEQIREDIAGLERGRPA